MPTPTARTKGPAYQPQAATPPFDSHQGSRTPKTSAVNALPPADEPGLFMHDARAPEKGIGEYDNQRRFGGHRVLTQHQNGGSVRTAVVMYRDAGEDTAELNLEMWARGLFCAESRLTLTADELQTLACALLDASHDLRTRPASSYQPGGAA